MFSKIKNKVSQFFSKSKLSKEEEKYLMFLQPWIVFEIIDPHEQSREDEEKKL